MFAQMLSDSSRQRLRFSWVRHADPVRGCGKVVEVDWEQNLVWSVSGLSGPCDAQRLDNGNTLIADSRGVREVTPSGTVAWALSRQDAVSVCRF